MPAVTIDTCCWVEMNKVRVQPVDTIPTMIGGEMATEYHINSVAGQEYVVKVNCMPFLSRSPPAYPDIFVRLEVDGKVIGDRVTDKKHGYMDVEFNGCHRGDDYIRPLFFEKIKTKQGGFEPVNRLAFHSLASIKVTLRRAELIQGTEESDDPDLVRLNRQPLSEKVLRLDIDHVSNLKSKRKIGSDGNTFQIAFDDEMPACHVYMFRYVSAEKRKQRRDLIKHTFDDGPFGTGDSDNADEGPSYY